MNVDAKPSHGVVFGLSSVSREGAKRIALRTGADIQQVSFFSSLRYPGDVVLGFTHIKDSGPSVAHISYLGTEITRVPVTDSVVILREHEISIVKYTPNGKLVDVAETINFNRKGVEWATLVDGPEKGSDVADAIDLDRRKRILRQGALRRSRGLF